MSPKHAQCPTHLILVGLVQIYPTKSKNYYDSYYTNLVGRPDLEDLGLYVKLIFQWIFKKWDEEACTRLIWLRIGAYGGYLRTR